MVFQTVGHTFAQLTGTNADSVGIPCPGPPGSKWEVCASYFTPHENVTLHATNNATIALKDGSTTLWSIATTTGGTGTMTADADAETLVQAEAGAANVFAAGESILFTIAKGGSGVSISGHLQATLRQVGRGI